MKGSSQGPYRNVLSKRIIGQATNSPKIIVKISFGLERMKVELFEEREGQSRTGLESRTGKESSTHELINLVTVVLEAATV